MPRLTLSKNTMPIIVPHARKLLKIPKKELQANTSLIEKDLGGRNHGNLVLLLTDEEHFTIPRTQLFETPTHPPP